MTRGSASGQFRQPPDHAGRIRPAVGVVADMDDAMVGGRPGARGRPRSARAPRRAAVAAVHVADGVEPHAAGVFASPRNIAACAPSSANFAAVLPRPSACASSSSRTTSERRSAWSARRSPKPAPTSTFAVPGWAQPVPASHAATTASSFSAASRAPSTMPSIRIFRASPRSPRAFGEADKAVLGICLGAQLVARGAGRHQHPRPAGRVRLARGAPDRRRPRRPGDRGAWRRRAAVPLAPRHLHPAARRRASCRRATRPRSRPSASAAPSTASSSISRPTGALVERWSRDFAEVIAGYAPDWPERHRGEAAAIGAQADAAGAAIARAWVGLIR